MSSGSLQCVRGLDLRHVCLVQASCLVCQCAGCIFVLVVKRCTTLKLSLLLFKNLQRSLFLIISGSKNKHPLYFLRLLLVKPLVKCVERRSYYSSSGDSPPHLYVILFMTGNFPTGISGDTSHVRAKGKYPLQFT